MLSRYNNSRAQVPGELDAVPEGGTSSILSDRILTSTDYLAMLQQSFGQIAQDHARLINLVDNAKLRDHTVMVNGLTIGADLSIPPGDMKSVIISRPTLSELTTTWPYNLQITFDGAATYTLPIKGMDVISLTAQWRTYRVTSPDAITASVSAPGNWAIYLVFTNRELQPGLNL